MDFDGIAPGRLCKSKAGRDKGNYFLVIDVLDSQYVKIADGVLRKVKNAKKKKKKHLHFLPEAFEDITKCQGKDPKALDAEIRKWLQAKGYQEKRRGNHIVEK